MWAKRFMSHASESFRLQFDQSCWTDLGFSPAKGAGSSPLLSHQTIASFSQGEMVKLDFEAGPGGAIH